MSPSLRNLVASAMILALTLPANANGASSTPPIMQEYLQRPLTKNEAPALIELADNGDGKAQLILGRAYMNGDGVPEDVAKGLHWLTLAAKNGYAQEVGMLADSALIHRREPGERKLAKDMYRSACDGGDMHACTMLGSTILDDREGVEEGLFYLRKAADNGHAGAQLTLGEYLGWVTSDKANILPRNDQDAFRWLLKAAQQGQIYAIWRVGQFYEKGQGIKQDLVAARQWYERGAELHFLGCQLPLGEMYEFGRGVPQDGAKAIAIYRAIADSGAVNAHENIGRIYEFGRGVPQSYTEAFKWYDAGRLMMDSNTAYRLGVLCEEGRVVPRDVQKAREYYKTSRTREAALKLGESYLNEPAPLQNPQEALTWLLVAKHKGSSQADSLLARATLRLSPAQRAKAETDANEWIEFDEE